MSDTLPEGWSWAPLNELAQPSRPRQNPREFKNLPFVGMEHVESSTRRLIGTVPSSTMKSTAFHFLPGDVLYGRLRPYLNKVLCAEIEGLCSSEFIVLPSARSFDSRFLAYYLSNPQFVAFANALNQGDRPRVSFDQIAEHLVPVPPLGEQRRIVSKLDLLAGRVETSRQRLTGIRQLISRFRQSVLAAACSGRLTADWRKQNPNIEAPSALVKRMQKAAAGIRIRRGVPEHVPKPDVVADWDLPTTWESYSAADLLRCGAFLDIKDGNHGSNHPKVSDFTDGGIPFITAAQVSNFRVDYDGAYKLSGKPLSRIRVGFAKPGDVLYTHKGSVGRVAIADRDCVLTPQTTYYRVSPSVFANKFLMFYLASPGVSEQVAIVKEQTTRDFVPISEQYLLFHRVPPLPEQQEIVRRVEQLFAHVNRIEDRVAEAEAAVDSLVPSLLAKAFSGELVTTEAELARREGRGYEPAAVLLERVLRERAGNEDKSARPGRTQDSVGLGKGKRRRVSLRDSATVRATQQHRVRSQSSSHRDGRRMVVRGGKQ